MRITSPLTGAALTGLLNPSSSIDRWAGWWAIQGVHR